MDLNIGSAASRMNLDIMEQQYELWQQDPGSVDRDWQFFFAGMELAQERPVDEDDDQGDRPLRDGDKGRPPGRASQQRIDNLIYAYRDLGHSICDLDPIGYNNRVANPALDIDTYDIKETQLDQRFATDDIKGLGSKTTLGELISFMRETYCGTIGVEYMHITDTERRNWLRDQVEANRNQPELSLDDKRRILIKLSQAALLEKFIHTKFFGQKRFSLEGAESVIPGLDAIVELAPDLGIKEIVMGMAHRGRLNVLCNVLDKSYEEVFTEFEENWDPSQMEGNGDVKYHLGFSTNHITANGRKIRLTLTANPSHLEAVNPVVLGRARAKQRQYSDTKDRSVVAPLLIHGDAAMAGQGLVMETFQLSDLDGYRTGGTIHIVINNQIGFTTLPYDSRSTPYCTDIAKMVEAPVWHVNGDDPEALVHSVRMALQYRQKFGRDVVIDLVCYRRYGHNETDEPNYTQPTMYALINKHPQVSDRYRELLITRGDLDQSEAEGIETIMKNQLQDALDQVKDKGAKSQRTQFEGVWKGFNNDYSHESVNTTVERGTLMRIGEALSTAPDNFNLHPTIGKLLTRRRKALEDDGVSIDWALGEMLAFGSLLCENIPVRLSGQDSRRGTFSQRHSYWYDLKTRERYSPLANIQDNQAKYCVYNSPLIEQGVLGFDFGYSLAEPNMLIIWEAQFGDFVNGAQVIIDQFITSCESKWHRVSGLVMMLPHGQEGAGPEHSSARLERFLEMCAEDNIQVAYCTTAAQHFHILRRQMHRDFRKPLVLMTPKGHLRSKESSSPLSDFTDGQFHEVLNDSKFSKTTKTVKHVVFCSGKIGHELIAKRDADKIKDAAVIRIEQLYPWPEEQINAALKRFPAAERFTFCQEEPHNFGAWHFVADRLRELTGKPVRYAGRDACSVPAPGSKRQFTTEQQQLLSDAFAEA